MTVRESFGPTLQRQRERRGVTLESIAQSTKISRSLLAALERGDVSKWPGGIYRRSYFREYAAAIGMPPEPALAEFVRLFPEPGQEPPAALDGDEPRPLRLTLVAEPRWKPCAWRGLAAALDAAAVLLVGYTLFALYGAPLWTTTAAIGLGYHAMTTLCLGKSPGAWCIARGLFIRRTERATEAMQLAELRRDWLTGFLQPTKGSTEGQAVT